VKCNRWALIIHAIRSTIPALGQAVVPVALDPHRKSHSLLEMPAPD
jgi:hypothetical protein